MSDGSSPSADDRLRLALPKGRMFDGVRALLDEAGLSLSRAGRDYRPRLGLPGCEVKLLKPQNIVEMLDVGSRDVGFAGADWVAELDATLVELLDTGLDPVRIVAAAPASLVTDGKLADKGLGGRALVVASEYETLTRKWMKAHGIEGRFVRTYGATEVFPPEDADIIVDNTATGATLDANKLVIVDEVRRSSTCMYASSAAMADDKRRARVENFALLVRAVLEARRRVMIEVNIGPDGLEALLAVLPAMRQPTVAQLAGEGGYAVKVAVKRTDLPHVIPAIKGAGGTDIVVSRPSQIVP